MSAAEFLKKLPTAFNAEEAAGSDCVLQFNVAQPVYITIKGGSCVASEGSAAQPDVTITMEDQDLIDLLKGTLNGMTAFMTGKLQVDGDLMLAQRLTSIFDGDKLAAL
ncbi:MAG: SCP2 sterol-binding domain-containing protein [Nevskia sp.]|nr:SCP2 sterol-binding domain-containing protein [Nevskia sp.]